MKIKSLTLERFGPFSEYHIDFPKDDNVCLLITGRNNEGKSTIIKALTLLQAAARIGKRKTLAVTKSLQKRDTEDIFIGRLIHNYQGETATIKGVFYNDSSITLKLDAEDNSISADYTSYLPHDLSNTFGFIPPLGQLAETEPIISNVSHLNKSLGTTLAPHHLRNHFRRFLSQEQFELVKTIISDSWEGIKLQNYEYNFNSNSLICWYEEEHQFREISWAGQGLQIWFQIITHMVRLMDTSILVLDEPEIFLHTQKQLDLIQILREYYSGSIIIATHSVELMNDVEISHIIHVQKNQTKPTIKSSTDRRFLNKVRSQLGSSFNLIASQFEDVDLLVFTESRYDFTVLSQFASIFGIEKRAFNVPINGFSEYPKSVFFKQAYRKFFGKDVRCSVFLDRDYYPTEYLNQVRTELQRYSLQAYFTPGKEIENLLLNQDVLVGMLPSSASSDELREFLDAIFESDYNKCLGDLITLHSQFPHGSRKEPNTILLEQKPLFDKLWRHPTDRFAEIRGKPALAAIRAFFKDKYNMTLPTKTLVQQLASSPNAPSIKHLLENVFQV